MTSFGIIGSPRTRRSRSVRAIRLRVAGRPNSRAISPRSPPSWCPTIRGHCCGSATSSTFRAGPTPRSTATAFGTTLPRRRSGRGSQNSAELVVFAFSMPRTFSQARVRVGLREVAAAANVCVMTVSLALRDNPRISAETRERIKRLAAELGYHPDPELARLMNHLRSSRTARGRIGVALIDFYPTADFAENIYNAKIRAGAEERAREL